MKKINKFLLSILALTFIVWLIGLIFRSIIAYDVFEPVKDLPIKSDKPYDALFQTVYIYSMLSFYTIISYIISFILVVYFTIILKNKLKSNGWLFMAIILFFLSSPVEIIRIYYDINLSIPIFIDGLRDFYSDTVNNFFIMRFKNIWMPTIGTLSVLANITVLIFVIWQPLKENDNNKQD